ncbi:hypothetical protein B0H12DRAFT_1093879 [Mycena haematopus]|nr:hypothetical protein B0H12DRAFT_1093879 [Mycena haematopus]
MEKIIIEQPQKLLSAEDCATFCVCLRKPHMLFQAHRGPSKSNEYKAVVQYLQLSGQRY